MRDLFGVMMESQEKGDFVRIDAGRSLEEVQQSIRVEVDKASQEIDNNQLPLRFVESW